MRVAAAIWRAWPVRAGAVFFLLAFLLPQGIGVASFYVGEAGAANWWQARRDSSAQAPDPATTPEAVIEVYAARAFDWRGAFGVHTWIAAKPAGAAAYRRYEVIGWRQRRGLHVVAVGEGIADAYWYGSKPVKLMSRRGQLDPLIAKIERAAQRYPFADRYRVWPGPNSNTFVAFVARQVPELGLTLPPLAIGKDFLANGVVAPAPSGSGWQLSLYGVAGLLLAREEGLEIGLLGLTFGVDLARPALKLPGLGRIGLARPAGG